MDYPTFLKFANDIVLVKISKDKSPATYYRHGGDYKIKVTLIDGKFFSGRHSVDHISKVEMFTSTLDEWTESNGQYATPEYIIVRSMKMKRINWDTYQDKTGRIKARVRFKNRAWEICKTPISVFIGYQIEPITEELFLK